MTVLQSLISPWKRKGKRRKEKLLQRKVFYGGLEGTSTYFFFIRDFFFFIRDCFFRPRLFSFCLRLFFYPRLLFLPRVLRLRAHVHWRAGLRSRAGNMAGEDRRFYGRRRHLGCEANTAKFTVNVWEKSPFWCSIPRGRLTFWISVKCKVNILAKRVSRLNLKGIGLLKSEKSSF